MKLNLWIVANCLHALEPVISVPRDAPAVLIGARTIYVPRCAYVYQKKSDVFVDAGKEGGYLIFENMNFREVLEMVQFTFDFYSGWEDKLSEAAEKMDYKQIIDQSWSVFKNPMMLLDAGNNLMAMSAQYRDDEVNEDWKYMARHKRSSLEVQQFLIENGAPYDYYMNDKSRIFHLKTPWINGKELSVAIFYQYVQYGRLNIVEKDRELNPGDLLMADHLVGYLAEILGRTSNQNQLSDSFASVYMKLLTKERVSGEELEYWKKTSGWLRKKKYRVVVCQNDAKAVDRNRRRSVENLIRSCFGDNGGIVLIKDKISFLLIDQSEKEVADKWKRLLDFSERFHLKVGVSLVVRDISRLYCYYDQGVKALEWGKTKGRTDVRGGGEANPLPNLYHFYNYAVDYILSVRDMELARYACQVDINNLWEEGKPDGGERVETLRAYLSNERSLVKAANELFIHRNTLVYRVNKILETLLCDLDDSYTREYMQLSIRVLRLYYMINNK